MEASSISSYLEARIIQITKTSKAIKAKSYVSPKVMLSLQCL